PTCAHRACRVSGDEQGEAILMDMLVALAEWSFLAFGLLLLLVQLAFHEVGYRLGVRNREGVSAQTESVSGVVGGILGLLAFVLALTLSFASTRYSDARQGTLSEANAIGTAWLRAGAIGLPRGDEVARAGAVYETAA